MQEDEEDSDQRMSDVESVPSTPPAKAAPKKGRKSADSGVHLESSDIEEDVEDEEGEDEDDVNHLRSERLKQWVVGVGKRERDRIRGLGNAALSSERQPRLGADEMATEHAVALPSERRGR